MAIIAKEIIPPKKEQATVRLNPEVMTQLEAYCRFISSSSNHVVERALLHVFNRDREFQEWLRAQGTTDGDA
jgi:predicted transcriptional regulator